MIQLKPTRQKKHGRRGKTKPNHASYTISNDHYFESFVQSPPNMKLVENLKGRLVARKTIHKRPRTHVTNFRCIVDSNTVGRDWRNDLENILVRFAPILALVGVGLNRIGKAHSYPRYQFPLYR